MKDIKLIKTYSINGCEFKINTRLSRTCQLIVTIVQYEGLPGDSGFQMNSEYVNPEKLLEHYFTVKERCRAIAERKSGWTSAVRTLEQLGFDVLDN